jgi:ankyrin repeat protein
LCKPHIVNIIFDKLLTGKRVLSLKNYNTGWSMIHYAFKYSFTEIIDKLIDKNVNLESETVDGWRPIHIACRYSTPELIIKLIRKGVDLKSVTSHDVKPIDILSKHRAELKNLFVKESKKFAEEQQNSTSGKYNLINVREPSIRNI